VKILYDHQCFAIQQYGGISRYHYHLIKELNKLNNVKAELALKYSNNYYIHSDKDFEVKQFFPQKSFLLKRTILDYINRTLSIPLIKNGNYDIFHPTYYNPYFFKYLKDKPFIITAHDTIQEMFPEIINGIDKTLEYKNFIFSVAKFIIANSENTKKDLMRIYSIPSNKITVVYLAASISKDMAAIREKLNLPEKYILFVGTRDFYKNFENFILAVEPLLKDHKELFVITAGGGYFTKSELNLFESRKIKDKVIFKEADDTILATLFANALAFVFPSKYEGFGIPVLEAMNCDCPVIISSTSSLPEVGGDAAVYFNPEDIEDIRQKIQKVVFNSELRQELITKGKIQRNKFSFSNTALQTHNVYRNILEYNRI
jgi:glycosyltransferase involved in cell wall biosynthesis